MPAPVAVLIATCDREDRLLHGAVPSALRQIVPPAGLLVVDDGRGLSAATRRALEELAAAYAVPLALLQNGRHKGAAGVWNTGLAHLAAHFGVAEHRQVDIDPRAFGGAILTGGDRAHGSEGAPSTYVPARNVLFLSYALAWSEVLGASDLFIGANADDAVGYPDCRAEILCAFERMADLGTHAGRAGRQRLQIRAPLLELRKPEVVALAQSLGVPLELTGSCYFPTEAGAPCGGCDACRLRHRALGRS